MNSRIPVSILMPVKNGMQYLEASRAQILENAGPNDQIVLVDDGSVDGSTEFLKNWANSDDRITFVRNKGKGIISALNIGLNESAYEWVARFDVDDVYSNDRLTSQLKCIKEGDVAIFSDYSVISATNKNLGTILSAIEPSATALSLISRQRTAHPSSIFNKEAALEVGGFREEDLLVEDLSLWMRLLKLGSIRSTPSILLKYRIHPNSTSVLNRSNMISAGRKIIDEVGISPIHFEVTKSNLSQIFSTYEAYDYSNARELLLIRDLYNFSRHYDLKLSGMRLQFEQYSHSALYPFTITCLTAEALRRRKYRNKTSPPKN